MLEKISHKMTGCVQVCLNGENSGRFINLAIKSGIRFWHYHREGPSYIISLRSSDYKYLRALRKRCNVKLRVIKKTGIPFLVRPLWKRPGLLLGFLGGILLYSFLAGNIWLVTVEGDGFYTKDQILKAAQNAGVFVGAARDGFDPQGAAHSIMRQLPQLSWASVNTQDCSAEIVVRQGEKKPEIIEENKPANLIASRTGVIKSIEAQEGMVRVKLNQAVKKGDLLVTGHWDGNEGKNEWELKDNPPQFFATARGKIMAETMYRFSASLPKTETVYNKQESHSRWTFGFFGIHIPFVPSLASGGQYTLNTSEEHLWLLGNELPIFLREERLTRLSTAQKPVGQAEAENRLAKLLLQQQRQVDGSLINQAEIVFGETADSYTARVDCSYLQNIAKPVEIEKTEEIDEKDEKEAAH